MGSQVLEEQEEWQLERRRFFSEASMAKIPEPQAMLEMTGGDPSEQATAALACTTPTPGLIDTELIDRWVANSAISAHNGKWRLSNQLPRSLQVCPCQLSPEGHRIPELHHLKGRYPARR